MPDYYEYIAGTDPHDSNSVLKVILVEGGSGGARIRFTAMTNISYTIQYRADPATGSWLNFTNIAPQPISHDVDVLDPQAGASGHRFYRIVTPQQQGFIDSATQWLNLKLSEEAARAKGLDHPPTPPLPGLEE